MKKHFKSEPKLYQKLGDSLSDTEIEFRKESLNSLTNRFQQKCRFGDEKLKFPSSKTNLLKSLKIKDEVKIDLGNFDSSSSSSVRSPPKIYTIQEVSEGVSHASSNMAVEQNKRLLQVQKIIEANRSKPRPMSRSRNLHKIEPLNIPPVVEVIKLFRSHEFRSESDFAEEFDHSYDRNKLSSYQENTDQFHSSYKSLASFKRLQIYRLTNDASNFQNRSEESRNFGDSQHELLSLQTYSTTASEQRSCFGCIFKPLAQMCRRKSKKI